ncbi:Uncharacterised protein [Vibrio cholerae]|uniref:Uncharacterized protein n=1 Tax=Vibrio cholerae TaxID=666 RepID=A0A655XVM9_VIBCL|nr:Uncharacterised protein [Vibrio cholerae]
MYRKAHLSRLRLARYRDHGKCWHRRLIYRCCPAPTQGCSTHEYCCYLWCVEYRPYTKPHNPDGFPRGFSRCCRLLLRLRQ